MISPICKVNNLSTLDGVDVTKNTTVTIKLTSAVGVNSWSIRCIYTDDGNDANYINDSLTINHITKEATFTYPNQPSALIFESKVNDGRDVNNQADPSLTARFGIFCPLDNGNRLFAFNQSYESSSQFGWTKDLNKLAKSVDGIIPITDHGMLTGLGDDDHTQYLNNARGDVRYAPLAHTQAWSTITSTPTTISGYGITNAALNTTSIVAGNGLTGGGTLAATRTLTVLSADATINVAAGGIKVGVLPFSAISSKPTTLSGYGITDGVNVSDLSILATANTVAKRDTGGELRASVFKNNDNTDTYVTSVGTGKNTIIDCPASGLTMLRYNGGNYFGVGSSGLIAYSNLTFFGNFDAQISHFAAGGGIGKKTTISGQSVITGAGTGGDLNLTSGSGTTAAGNVYVKTGTTDKIVITPTLVSIKDNAEITGSLAVTSGISLAGASSTSGQIRIATGSVLMSADDCDIMSYRASKVLHIGSGTTGLGPAAEVASVSIEATSNVRLCIGSTYIVTVGSTAVNFSRQISQAISTTAVTTTSTTLDCSLGNVHVFSSSNTTTCTVSLTNTKAGAITEIFVSKSGSGVGITLSPTWFDFKHLTTTPGALTFATNSGIYVRGICQVDGGKVFVTDVRAT